MLTCLGCLFALYSCNANHRAMPLQQITQSIKWNTLISIYWVSAAEKRCCQARRVLAYPPRQCQRVLSDGSVDREWQVSNKLMRCCCRPVTPNAVALLLHYNPTPLLQRCALCFASHWSTRALLPSRFLVLLLMQHQQALSACTDCMCIPRSAERYTTAPSYTGQSAVDSKSKAKVQIRVLQRWCKRTA